MELIERVSLALGDVTQHSNDYLARAAIAAILEGVDPVTHALVPDDTVEGGLGRVPLYDLSALREALK